MSLRVRDLGDLALQVDGRRKSANRLHRAGTADSAVARLKLRRAGRRAEERGQVAARRKAPGAEAIRSQRVLCGVGAQPAHGGFAVLQLCGEDSLRAEAVIDGGNGVPLFK